MSDTPPPPPPPPPADGSAAAQPHKKPWWKRPWGIGLIILVVIIAMATCGEDGEEAADQAAPTATPTETGTESPPDEATEAITPVETTPPEEVAEEVTEEPAEPITEEPAAPAFEPITFSGTGDDVVDVSMPTDEPAFIHLTHEGGANFAVISYGPDGNQLDLLANVIGAYDGNRPINFSGTEPVAQLEITADGPWSAEIRPLADARTVEGTSVDGTGPDVVLLGDVDASSAQVEHIGEANFAVIAWGESRDLLINEIGNYSGRVRIPPGTIVFDVEADGTWSFDFS